MSPGDHGPYGGTEHGGEGAETDGQQGSERDVGAGEGEHEEHHGDRGGGPVGHLGVRRSGAGGNRGRGLF